MPRPSSLTFELGADAYGRRTQLIWRQNGSHAGWTIIRLEANQRDEREIVSLLTDEQLRLLGQIAEEKVHRHG